jgi:DNA-binding NarL/FixJ family response regulator
MSKLHIIHLDDHRLMRKGIEDCFTKEFPDAWFNGFENSQTALAYINGCFESGVKINLIITDYAHPGANGIEFAKLIRAMEAKLNIRTPIMLISMHGSNKELFTVQNAGLFDGVFGKNTMSAVLINFVKEVAIV